MRCPEARDSVAAYVDGELAGGDRDEFEKHARECEVCARLGRRQAHFKAALRVALPRKVASGELRRRIDAALAAESPPRRRWLGPVRMRSVRFWPVVAVAAGAAVFVGVSARDRSSALTTAQALFRADPPPDVRGPHCDEAAAELRKKVGFRVELPVLGPGYRCRGGRLVTVGDRLAANLVYEAPGGHLVSYVLYDASNEPPLARERLRASNRDIYIDQGPGFTTAAYREPGGLGTVVTSDMNRDSLIQLVSYSAH